MLAWKQWKIFFSLPIKRYSNIIKDRENIVLCDSLHVWLSTKTKVYSYRWCPLYCKTAGQASDWKTTLTSLFAVDSIVCVVGGGGLLSCNLVLTVLSSFAREREGERERERERGLLKINFVHAVVWLTVSARDAVGWSLVCHFLITCFLTLIGRRCIMAYTYSKTCLERPLKKKNKN